VNGFQWMACTALGVALVADLRRSRRSPSAVLRISRAVVWSTAIVAIAKPALVTRVANLLGIGRGADIVLYVVALAFVALAFYFHAQQTRLRRELSALASHVALREATRGGRVD
jgi:hypothetical protein